MFHRPTNPVSHRLARLAFYLACVAGLTVAACGPAHRYLGLDLDWALTVFRLGFYAAAAAVALALATVVPTRPGDRRRGFVAALMALAIGVAAAWWPAQWLLQTRSAPRINDVTTDTANVPAMVVTQQMRHGSPNPAAYPGDGVAAQQRAAYPDIVPVVINASPAEAFRKVDQAAMGTRRRQAPLSMTRSCAGVNLVSSRPDFSNCSTIFFTCWLWLTGATKVASAVETIATSFMPIADRSRPSLLM